MLKHKLDSWILGPALSLTKLSVLAEDFRIIVLE